MSVSIIDEVVEQLQTMPQHLQWQVLEFARTLVQAEIRGTPGRELLQFAGSISPQDLQLISETIEQDCEQIDVDEWLDCKYLEIPPAFHPAGSKL